MDEGIDKVALGDRISIARRELGLHQKDLADQLGVSLRSLQMYESGVSTGVFRHLEKLGEILNRSSAWMLYGEREGNQGDVIDALDALRSDVEDRLQALALTMTNVERMLIEQRELAAVRERLERLEGRMSNGPI